MNAKWQLATAAEAFAAARFARLGCNVSVQYGANQPEYDLMIDKAGEVLKVSVKGSGKGGWGLSQSQLATLGDANYHGAAEAWLARHKPGTVLCLVQFKGTQPDEMPRIYLASPTEIADKLRSASGGRGDTILWEDYQRGPRAEGAGTVERLPQEWLLSEGRINELLRELTVR